MIARPGNALQHRDRGVVAGAAVGRAVGVDAATVRVLRGGPGPIHGRIRFHVARQMLRVGANVADFEEVFVEQRPLDTEVPVLDRWGLQVYQKSGYENTVAPWDGRGNVGQWYGKLVERGTYFYLLELGNGMKRLEGYVVVIR